jgi:hypothetical protein
MDKTKENLFKLLLLFVALALFVNGYAIMNRIWYDHMFVILLNFEVWMVIITTVLIGVYWWNSSKNFSTSEFVWWIVLSFIISFTSAGIGYHIFAHFGDTEIWNSTATYAEYTEAYVDVSTSKDSDGKTTTSRTNKQSQFAVYTEDGDKVDLSYGFTYGSDNSYWNAYVIRWCGGTQQGLFDQLRNRPNMSVKRNLMADEPYGADLVPEIFTCNFPGNSELAIPTAVTHITFNYVKAAKGSVLNPKAIQGFEGLITSYPKVYAGQFGPIELTRVFHPGVTLPNGFAEDLDRELDKALQTLGKRRQVNIVVYFVPDNYTYYDAIRGAWEGGGKNDCIVVVGMKEGSIKWADVIGLLKYPDIRDRMRFRLTSFSSLESGKAFAEQIIQQVEAPGTDGFVRKPMAEMRFLAKEVRIGFFGSVAVVILAAAWLIPAGLFFSYD